MITISPRQRVLDETLFNKILVEELAKHLRISGRLRDDTGGSGIMMMSQIHIGNEGSGRQYGNAKIIPTYDAESSMVTVIEFEKYAKAMVEEMVAKLLEEITPNE